MPMKTEVALRRRRAARFTTTAFRRSVGLRASLYGRGIGRSMGRMQQVLLTTTGRVSGKTHTVALSAVPEAGGWVVIGSFGGAGVDPNWWLNLVAHPEATIQVNDQVLRVRMQQITDPTERDRIWNAIVEIAANYAGYARKTCRVIPLGLLRPIA